MAIADNRYSRFVQLAKIVFPLVALALLSTLFLFSRSIDPSRAIPFAEIDVEKIAREQRLARPKFSGVTEDGSEVLLIAESATPDPVDPRKLSAEIVEATIAVPDGETFDVDANRADFDGGSDILELQGDVTIRTASGYTLATDTLITSVATTTLKSPTSVFVTGPEGTLEADSMELGETENGQVVVFKGNVKLIYRPGQ